MLNRNGLFSGREDKNSEKNKQPAGDVLGIGALNSRSPLPIDSMASSSNASRAPRDAGTTTATPSTEAVTKVDETTGSKLIVGPNIKLKGVEITDCDTLVVEGHVEATMDSRAIQIAESGSFSGVVGIDVAEIRGSFSGELTVRKKLVIHSTGRVSGKVRYGKLVIEEGGELSGEIKMIAQGQEQPSLTGRQDIPVQTTRAH